MPLPYFDNLEGKNHDGYHGSGFFASWDNDTKEFTLTYMKEEIKGNKALPINLRGGYLKSSDYIALNCDHCGTKITNNKLNTDDGFTFCSVACLEIKGYITVLQGNGAALYTKENPEEFIRADDGTIFSTLAAAQNLGYHLKISDYGAIAEDNEVVSGRGYRVVGVDGVCYQSPAPEHPRTSFLIPVEIVAQQKNVEFAENEGIEFGAAA